MKSLMSEIWASVITTSCPHCQGKSPAFRKDGYTKIFQRPLSEKMRNTMEQAQRIGGGSSRKASASAKSATGEGDAFEIGTEMSTRQHTNSLGHSAFGGDDDEDREDEEEDVADDIALDQ